MREASRVEQVVGVAALLLLFIGCFVVLQPFITAVLWALILVFATWPIYAWWERRVNGRRDLAATFMTLLIAAVVLVPLVILGSSLTDDVADATARIRVILQEGLPDPPPFIAHIPLVGGQLYDYWSGFAHNNVRLSAEASRYLFPTGEWILTRAAGLGQGTLQFALSLFISFFFYRDGIEGTNRLAGVVRRLWGEQGLHLLAVASATIKGVVYGILGTAAVQGTLLGFGLWMAAVPAALLLGFVTFFVSFLPIGAPLIWIPATAWLFYIGATGRGIFLLLWSVFLVSTIDNFIRPFFIGRGSDLPFILTFLGVLGGAFAFGILGIFLGPTLLAVGYNIIRDWSQIDRAPAADEPPSR